jgi:hypothetical protein
MELRALPTPPSRVCSARRAKSATSCWRRSWSADDAASTEVGMEEGYAAERDAVPFLPKSVLLF